MFVFHILTSLLAYSVIVECRDPVKPLRFLDRSIPTITNSLVNLGKMDISFHFNTKGHPLQPDTLPMLPNFLMTKSQATLDDSCLCSNFKSLKDPLLSRSSDIFNKILTSNSLFSHKEPFSSTACCDSHEQDNFVTFEFSGSQYPNTINKANTSPLLFTNPTATKQSPKGVEIFLFPKKRDLLFEPVKKDWVKFKQGVKDKELKEHMKYKPVSSASSVKKDLTAQEKDEIKDNNIAQAITEASLPSTTLLNPNSLVY